MSAPLQIGVALPEKIVTNDDLCLGHPDWSPEKIFAKTGIASRHVSRDDETVIDLAARACEDLFRRGLDRGKVDFILFCTQSSAVALPSCACLLQRELGLSTNVGALDVGLGCSGFVYSLSLAKGLIASQAAAGIMLVTADTYTKFLANDDRSTRAIFGDGAAAVFIDGSVASRLGAFHFGTDGRGAEQLIVRKGSPLYMNGPEIFNFTLDVVPDSLDAVCRKNALKQESIDLFVFHQANAFMLDTLRKVCAIDESKLYVNLADTGNTVSSSIPIALMRAQDAGVIHEGMTVALVGFGVGLSWCATILKT